MASPITLLVIHVKKTQWNWQKHDVQWKQTLKIERSGTLSLSLEHLEGKDYDTMDKTRWSRWLCWWLRTTLTLIQTLTLTLARCGGKPDPITEIKPDHYSLANVPLSRRGPLFTTTTPPTSSKPLTQLHQTRNVVHPEKFPALPLFTRRLLKRSLFTRKNWKNCPQNTQHCTDCTNCTFAHLTIAQIALKMIEISDSNHWFRS